MSVDPKVYIELTNDEHIAIHAMAVHQVVLYNDSIRIHFYTNSPDSIRYGEEYHIPFDKGVKLDEKLTFIRELIAWKREEIDSNNCYPPQNQSQFNRVSMTVGQRLDSGIGSLSRLVRKFKPF